MISSAEQLRISGHSKGAIYEYSSVSGFLRDVLDAKKRKNPAFSARAWAKRLGFKNGSLLIDILNGRRRLNSGLGGRIADDLPLSSRERAYYDILVLSSSAKTKAERDFYGNLLGDLRPDQHRSDLKLSHFRLIADWYHFTLLEAMSLKDFKNDATFLSRRLRGRLSPETINLAFQRLKELGLVKEADSKLVRSNDNPVLSGEVPSFAVKNHHREILTRAREALREQEVDERDFRSSQLSFRKENYPKVKELIRNFHRAIQNLSEKEGVGDDVYALNTQFFKLTREVGD